MSCGHCSRGCISSNEVERVLANPDVREHLAKPYSVSRDYDLPYLAGYSQDGSKIYIDRHLPEKFDINGRSVDLDPFLVTHERTEKAVIDGMGYRYEPAHELARAVERRQVVGAGLKWQAYSKVLEPYIKQDEHEKMERVPPDLDLTPYQDEGDTALLKHMQKAMK